MGARRSRSQPSLSHRRLHVLVATEIERARERRSHGCTVERTLHNNMHSCTTLTKRYPPLATRTHQRRSGSGSVRCVVLSHKWQVTEGNRRRAGAATK